MPEFAHSRASTERQESRKHRIWRHFSVPFGGQCVTFWRQVLTPVPILRSHTAENRSTPCDRVKWCHPRYGVCLPNRYARRFCAHPTVHQTAIQLPSRPGPYDGCNLAGQHHMLFEHFLTQIQRRLRARNRRGRSMRTRGVSILNTRSDFRHRSAPKAFRTNNLWLRSRVPRSSTARMESRPTGISLVAEALETRTLLTGFSENVATLNIDVQTGETVTIVANASSYTLTSTGTWSAARSARLPQRTQCLNSPGHSSWWPVAR